MFHKTIFEKIRQLSRNKYGREVKICRGVSGRFYSEDSGFYSENGNPIKLVGFSLYFNIRIDLNDVLGDVERFEKDFFREYEIRVDTERSVSSVYFRISHFPDSPPMKTQRSLVGVNPIFVSTLVLHQSGIEVNLENLVRNAEEEFSEFLKKIIEDVYKIDVSCFYE